MLVLATKKRERIQQQQKISKTLVRSSYKTKEQMAE
jgi:hypothetical protein